MKPARFILTGLTLSAAIAAGALAAGDPAEVGRPAPGFTLMDSNGATHSLSDFKGKFVVLEWVNFGCPFVRKHYDSGNMQSLQKIYTGKGVIWLSICSSAPGKQGYFEGDELKRRITSEKSNATGYLLDPNGATGKAYGAKTTPHLFVIDPEGVLIYAGGIDNIASTDHDDIARATNYVSETLDTAMLGKEVKTKTSRPYGCSVKYK